MVDSAFDERLGRPQPLVRAYSKPETPGASPTVWKKQENFGGVAHPETEDQSFVSAGAWTGNKSEAISPAKNLKTAGYSGGTWGFDMLQKEQVGTYRPPGSVQ